MADNRFTVTKCDEHLPNGLNDRRGSNMNTIDVKKVTPKESKKPQRSKSVSFETGRQRWMNVDLDNKRDDPNDNSDQAYDNPTFSIDSDSEEEIIGQHSNTGNLLNNSANTMNEQTVEGDQTSHKDWDNFDNLPPEEDDILDSKWINIPIAVLKLLIYILTFVLLLFSAFLSISTLLLMTSMIRNDQKVTLCSDQYNGITYEADYSQNSSEKIGWIWCLFVVMSAPLVLTFYRCFKFCIFKNFERPRIMTFIIVSDFHYTYSHYYHCVNVNIY